uniref:Lipase_3 domain-containing protein n=1 Tax=Strongyloides papillosus TaxID=174720 RepID=A0A0N5BA86_STREA
MISISIIIIGLIFQVCAFSNYDSDLAFNAYKVTASTYTDNNENLISQCLNAAFGSFNNLAHSSFTCYKDDDSCTGVFAIFPDINTTLIAFRGTKNILSYLHQIENAYNFVLYDSAGPSHGYVEKYYKNAAEDVFNKFITNKIVNSPKTTKYIVTGHSLGGALAVLTALKLVTTLTAKPEDIHVITFGQPRIGDYQFSDFVQGNLPNLYRLVHYKDVIPHFPACAKEKGSSSKCVKQDRQPFHHTREVFYNSDKNSTQYDLCDPGWGEDPTCSDGLDLSDNIEGFFSDYHNTYFNINIQKFGERGCQNSAHRIFSSLLYILITIKLFDVFHVF